MEYVGNIIYDTLLMQDGLELVIFGAGKSGKKVYEFLDRNSRAQNVKYFCDSDEKIWGKKIMGIMVVSPSYVINSETECHILVSGKYVDEMANFLLENGVKKVHLLFL